MTNKYMYFIANWKMFGDLRSINSLNKVIKFFKIYKKKKFVKIIYCPPNTLIRAMSEKLYNSKIGVGAQNCHENENAGAFTGSVNSKMLKNVGAKYVIITSIISLITTSSDVYIFIIRVADYIAFKIIV